MFLNTELYDKLWLSLSSNPNPSFANIQQAVSAAKPSLASLPQIENLHSHTYLSLPELNGKLVSLRMMIQDIYETEFYSAAIVKQNKVSTKEELEKNIVLNKYWINGERLEEIEDSAEHVILDREVFRAIVPKGQSEWVTQKNGGGNIESVILKCFSQQGFKLGQIVNVIGIVQFDPSKPEQPDLVDNKEKDLSYYYPVHKTPRINVIATLNEEQISEHHLDFKAYYLKQEIDFAATRQKLLSLFTRFCSPKYAQFLLYSIVNNSQRMNLYLSGENLEPLLKYLLPFLVKVDMRLPFKQELFPKKVDVIKDSLLQLSNQQTYVILDFTNIGEVKLQGEEVIALQNLKRFAEDSELVYRWEIGESVFTRNSSGIIAKASTIIEPTFNLKNQIVNLEKLPSYEEFEDIVEELRAYILQVRKRSESVFLSSDSEKHLIELDFVDERQETEGKLTPETFSQRLLIARLEAASLGESELTHKVYQRIKEITK